MGSHQGKAYECILWCTSRRNDGIDEHTRIKCKFGHQERLGVITHIQRDDRALGLANLEALLTEALQRIVGDIPQGLATLWLILDDMKSLKGACRGSRRVTGLENVGAGGVTQVVDSIPVGSNKATD